MKKPASLRTPSVKKRKEAIQSFKARANAKRSVVDKTADWFTFAFGTISFLVANVVFFAMWIVWNVGLIPGLKIIDPYPFGFLTMAVSLEAIVLSIIVLVSQNREGKIAELREEVELYINTYAESEITKILYLVSLVAQKQGIDISEDSEIQKMLVSLECEKIEEQLQREM